MQRSERREARGKVIIFHASIYLATLLSFFIVLCADALSAKRVALVIGNGSYKHATELANPKNDAQDVSKALQALGFDVTTKLDLSYSQFRSTVRKFAAKLSGAEVSFLFFAGHGMQLNGENYLIPVDAQLQSEADVDFEAIPLSLLLKQMERETTTGIVLLDACRDNPLARNLARSLGTRSAAIGRGLAEQKTGIGTLIGFSTQPGNVALDGDGTRNSPYAAALLAQLKKRPVEDIASLLVAVRNDVVQATDGKQVPWEHTSLLRRVRLDSNPKSKQKGAVSSGPQQGVGNTTKRLVTLAPETIFQTTNPEKLQALTRTITSRALSELARYRLKILEQPDFSPFRKTQSSALKESRSVENLVAIGLKKIKNSPSTFKDGLRLLEIAAVKGVRTDVMNAIGLVLYRKSGATYSDYEFGLRWLKEAALRGFDGAFSNIGVYYQEGKGVVANGRIAVSFYEEAVKNGSAADGYNQLGYIYQTGIGIPRDQQKAFQYFEKAYEVGSPAATYNIGWYYANGIGRRAQPRKGAELLLEAIELGYEEGLRTLTTGFHQFNRPTRLEIQAILKAKGLLNGFEAGRLDAATRAALKRLAGK